MTSMRALSHVQYARNLELSEHDAAKWAELESRTGAMARRSSHYQNLIPFEISVSFPPAMSPKVPGSRSQLCTAKFASRIH